MPGTRRSISEWRQGHVLTDDATAAFGLTSSGTLADIIAVVVSHDCDIAAGPEIEPFVEVEEPSQVMMPPA